MKKFFALVLALMIGFAAGSIRSAEKAEAVTISTPNYGTHDTVTDESVEPIEEEVRFILSNGGSPVGVLTEHEATYRKNLGIQSYNGRTVKSAMSNGRVVRAKNVATVTLDAENRLLQGSSIVQGTIEYLDDSVKGFSAAELIDFTVVAHSNGDGTYTAYHRFIQSDSAGEKVAMLHLPSGKRVSIWLTDWNGDGLVAEYALRAGTASNGGNSTSDNSTPSNPTPSDPTPSDPTPSDPVKPNPENDDVILPPSIGGGNSNSGESSSGGSTNSPAPNPENDNVTLPWG